MAMDEAEKLKKQVEVLEKKLALYEKDATYRGFYALNRIVNQQVDFMNQFDLKHEIGQSPKDDKVYDRAKGIWESFRTLAADLRSLKSDLGIIDEEEEKDRFVKTKITTPESMADALGNTAGKQN